MVPSLDPIEYSPNAVPERDGRFRSYRDDVRRTIFRHNFRPSSTHFSRLSDIYAFFLADNGYKTDSPLLQEKFRSALGRVLRPPSTADEFALSFAVPSLTKYRGYVSIVSPDCPSVLLADEIREKKLENGRRRREAADDCKEISRLRQSRLERKLNAPTDIPEQTPPKLSFRYVDELISMNCAEDLLKLKVCYFYILLNASKVRNASSSYFDTSENIISNRGTFMFVPLNNHTFPPYNFNSYSLTER